MEVPTIINVVDAVWKDAQKYYLCESFSDQNHGCRERNGVWVLVGGLDVHGVEMPKVEEWYARGIC